MPHSTHTARITRPLIYVASSGEQIQIPMGPCLVEEQGDDTVDIIWGTLGEKCAALPTRELEAAEEAGSLVLLD
jgi:hypothetical protein